MPTRTYQGESVDIQYDVKRCIHSEACVKNLATVFNLQQKPWIQPNNSEAEAVAETIMQCPTGALHFTRKDGGAEEAVPDENTIHLGVNGPLYVRGNIILRDTHGNTETDTRVALCRCGAAENKPFCDNTHLKIEFQHSGELGQNWLKTVEGTNGTLTVEPQSNASLKITGQLKLISADGETIYEGNQVYLCRCGQSKNKPFCDGSHQEVGFISD